MYVVTGKEIQLFVINQLQVKYREIASLTYIDSYILPKTVLLLDMVILITIDLGK